MRILLVEDNRDLAEWLARALRDSGYDIDCMHDGTSADLVLRSHAYALVILDLALPRLDGRELLKRLRARGDEVPVLILTATNTAASCVDGLDIGADDYVAKPFDVGALEARMRALLRRTSGHRNPLVQCGSLTFDSNTRQFTVQGREVALTRREHAVLELLITHVGKTVSKTRIAESLMSIDDHLSADAIEVYVHRVRRKIEGGSASIITLRGLGYLLKEHAL
jgi:two-component system response regulator TctD